MPYTVSFTRTITGIITFKTKQDADDSYQLLTENCLVLDGIGVPVKYVDQLDEFEPPVEVA